MCVDDVSMRCMRWMEPLDPYSLLCHAQKGTSAELVTPHFMQAETIACEL
jgi:hypothetical protein